MRMGGRTELAWCVVLAASVCLASGCGRPRRPRGVAQGAPVVEKSGTVDADKALPDVVVDAKDWPWWRGPTRDGMSTDAAPPTMWSATENVVWKTPVPGRGHSSAIVWKDRVFVATAVEEPAALKLLGLDRSTGKVLWTTDVHQGTFDHAHEKNSQASATPACDGERVFITFLHSGRVWLTATDLDGKKVYQKEAGPFASQHGYAASPLIWKSLVIVSGESDAGSFLCAYQRQTGDLVWSVKRGDSASYSSPTIFEVAGKPQLLISGGNKVQAYSPDDGSPLWTYEGGPSVVTSGTMVAAGDNVFASGGFPEQRTLCLKGGGSGKLADADVVWQNREKFYVPSMLCRDGSLYGVNDSGIAFRFDATTGKEVWKKRLGGGFSGSPVWAAGRLYVSNEDGKTFVFKAGTPAYEEVAVNELPEGIMSSPAICGGRVYLRTASSLYCVGNAAPSKSE
jgi:outer membrane protein assembly factor BamB